MGLVLSPRIGAALQLPARRQYWRHPAVESSSGPGCRRFSCVPGSCLFAAGTELVERGGGGGPGRAQPVQVADPGGRSGDVERVALRQGPPMPQGFAVAVKIVDFPTGSLANINPLLNG